MIFTMESVDHSVAWTFIVDGDLMSSSTRINLYLHFHRAFLKEIVGNLPKKPKNEPFMFNIYVCIV